MRAIQFEEPYKIRSVQVKAPAAPGPGEALVKTHSVGICGTDASAYRGTFPFFDFPRIPGHELGVEVVSVGEGVTDVAAGDTCSVEPYLNCGNCYACNKGRSNCCEDLSVVGVMQDGGLRDYFKIRSDKLHKANNLTFDQLALTETLTIGCHASTRAAPTAKDQLLIIGLGPIGLAALEFVRLRTSNITVMDRIESRIDFCKETYGPVGTIVAGEGTETEQIRNRSNGQMFDVVIDATGSPQSMTTALTYASQGGSVIFLGLSRHDINFSQPEMHRRELTLIATRNALPDDFRTVINAISDGTIDTAPWITHRIPFAEVEQRFGTVIQPDSGVLKAVIRMV